MVVRSNHAVMTSLINESTSVKNIIAKIRNIVLKDDWLHITVVLRKNAVWNIRSCQIPPNKTYGSQELMNIPPSNFGIMWIKLPTKYSKKSASLYFINGHLTTPKGLTAFSLRSSDHLRRRKVPFAKRKGLNYKKMSHVFSPRSYVESCIQ